MVPRNARTVRGPEGLPRTRLAAPQEAPNEVRSLAGLARRPEYRSAVLAPNLQPGRQIIGMLDGRNDAKGRTQEGAHHLCDQLLPRIELGAETARKIARESRLMAGPVAKFIETDAVIIDLIEEGRLRRNQDVVGGRPRRLEQPLRILMDLPFRDGTAGITSDAGHPSH